MLLARYLPCTAVEKIFRVEQVYVIELNIRL